VALTGALALAALAVSVAALREASGHPKAAAPLLGVAAAGIVVAARPRWLVPAFLALTWSSLDASSLGGLPSVVQVGGFALLAVAAVYAFREPARMWMPLGVTALIGLAMIGTGLLAPGGPHVDVHDLRDLAFILIAALCIRDAAGVERTFVALAITAVILGVGAAYSVLVHPTGIFTIVDDTGAKIATGVFVTGTPRAAGPFGEPNFFALSLAALVPIALHLIAQQGWRRLLGAAAGVAIAAGILASGSRGGLIAAGIALAGFALTANSRALRVLPILAVLALLALLPLFTSQTSSSSSRTISGRATENEIALSMFVHHPLTGVGPGEYPVHYRDYARHIGNDPRVEREPHSLPLQIAAEQGAVGILAWLVAGFAVVRLAFARRLASSPTGRIVLLAGLAYLTGSLFLHGSQLRLPYILAGLVLALCGAAARKERPARETKPLPSASVR
jgi:O-antigen ligase